MSKFKKHQKKFSLEGKVQEVKIKDGYKLKYVYIETPAGNNYIVKVAKGLRRKFSSVLIPGLEVKIIGEMTVCKNTGEEELEAFEIIPRFSKNATESCFSLIFTKNTAWAAIGARMLVKPIGF